MRRLFLAGGSLLLLAAVAVAVLVFWPAPAERFSMAPEGGEVVPVHWEECGFRLPTGLVARCGWFETGARTGNGDGIRLPVLELRRVSQPDHAPLTVHLPGGPGVPAGTGADAAWQWGRWMLAHDFPGRLLLFDPRGTGRARPALNCPGRALAARTRLARFQFNRASLEWERERLTRCRERLIEAGTDPADFAAHRMLVDVPRLIRAVGEHRVRLLGLSHGSRMALALLRQSPERFSSVVLDGVFPLERDPLHTLPGLQTEARSRLFRVCDRDGDCGGAALRSAYEMLRERLARRPVLMHVPLGDGPPQPVWLDAQRLSDLVFAAQSGSSGPAALPSALRSAVDGDFGPFSAHVAGGVAAALRPRRHEPVYWASLCAETAAGNSDGTDRPALEATHPCRNGWGSERLPSAFRAPVGTDHPALLLAGALDPVTPLAWAREQAKRMDRGRLLTGPSASHGMLFSGDCVGEAVSAFLADPDSAGLPATCPPAAEPVQRRGSRVPSGTASPH